jgi:Holliday junction resolvase RusA-like endonuclease
MSGPITFTVYGDPAPQGSKTPGVTKDGKPYMRESSSNKVKAWRKAVVAAARALQTEPDTNGTRPPLTGPLRARIVFTMPMSAVAAKERRAWPAQAPDLSKLLRATEDALKDGGLIADDSLIVDYTRLAKVYPGHFESLDRPGARITIEQIQPDQETIPL